MARKYKPGQFVWANGKQHRVVKASSEITCKSCPYEENHTCTNPENWICLLLPPDCYPKPVNYG